MAPSMNDVAAHAQVSVATVSHVINNSKNVKPETRAKVLASIEELGYVRNSLARSFKTGRKNLVGFIVPDISNPVWAMIIEEIEGTLAADDYRLLIVNTKETKHREIDNLRLLSSGLTDGIIVASTLDSYKDLVSNLPDGFPLVLIDRQFKSCSCDMVYPQDYPAVYDSVCQLIQNGHKCIGMITGLSRLSTTEARYDAYKAALSDNGIPFDRKLVKYGTSIAGSAAPLFEELLAQGCSAVVVSNNVMLTDVLYYVSSNHLQLGKGLEIVGQGVEGQKNYFGEGVHLYIQPSKDLGRNAAALILRRINDPAASISTIALQSFLPEK